jgi:TolB protein
MHRRIGCLVGTLAVMSVTVAACGGGTERQVTSEPTSEARGIPTQTTVPATARPLGDGTTPTTTRSAPQVTPTALTSAATPTDAPVLFDSFDGTAVESTIDLEIFVMNADGSGQRQLTNAPDQMNASPIWSPDGRSIAFTRWMEQSGALMVMDAAGENVRQLTDFAASGAAWSPDGRRIVFASGHGYAGEYPQIYVVDASGGEPLRLTSHVNVPTLTLSTGNGSPAWSPDGRQIAFVADQIDGPSEIHVMNADGTDVRRLTDSPDRKAGPTWSPDGTRLAFWTDFEGVDVWVMRADGSEQRNLTDSPSYEVEPVWSPDGTQLAFTRFGDAGIQIVVINADGSSERVIHDSPDHVSTLRWSPDGQRIAFVSGNPERNSDIVVINADGSELRKLTDTSLSESGPMWSPDGALIVYTTEFSSGDAQR